ncbi:MAG: 1,4-dihydroxy-2-naphthoate polyprenyltransferase [Deltaproteobacteria bacterium]|nr:MAG: 1,4-dihydroxy-2-naphthoate polyprenyltransferase [Deltaproteobacteria bacterium]
MAAVGAPLASGWRAYRLAARPQTLAVGIAPVALGTALAHADGSAGALAAAAALLCAVCIQIGTNFANDLFDAERGADTADRIGPPRATQLGLLSPARMRVATGVAFALAAVPGLYLIWLGGWPIALLGALAIAAGVAYTGGPFPLGYHGLGDLTVFVFFGLVAVCGTYYVQVLDLPARVVIASLPIAALATAVLVVNNVRDLETDARAGKRTLAVRLGRRATRFEYAALLALAYAVPPALVAAAAAPAAALLPLLTLPFAIRNARAVFRSTEGPPLNAALQGTARLELAYALLFAAGWLA